MNPLRALFILVALAVVGGVAYFMSTSSSSSDGYSTGKPQAFAGRVSNKPVEAPKLDADSAKPDSEAATPTRAVAESAPTPGEPKNEASRAACRVTGRVVDDNGAPLAGIPVSLATINGFVIIDEKGDRQAPRDKSTKTGRDGRFALDGVHAGFGTNVRVEPDKFVMAEKPVPKQEGGTIDLGDFVCSSGSTLVGRVVNDAGNPIVAANVEAWTVEKAKGGGAGLIVLGDSGQGKSRKTVTDGSGNFRIDGLAPGEAAVAVAAEGHTREFKKGIELKKGEIAPEVVVTLSSGLSIEGVVLDTESHPVPGAKIRIMDTVLNLSEGGLSNSLQQSREIDADASGNFRLTGLKETAYHVVGRAPGYLPSTKESVASGSKDVRIELVKSGVVYGYVRSEKDQKAITKFKVSMDQNGFGGPVFIGRDDAEAVYGAEAAKLVGVAESAGLFAFPVLPSENISLAFEADGFAGGTTVELTVKGGTRVQRDVQLEPEIRLSGIVLDSDGKGVEGARVTLGKHEEATADGGGRVFARRARVSGGPSGGFDTFDGEGPSATSAADGTFTLKGLRAGDFELAAAHPVWAPSDKLPVTLKAGDDLEGIKIALKEAGVLSGVAYDADGKPLSGGMVTVKPKRKDRGGNAITAFGGDLSDLPGLPRSQLPLVATSGVDGKFKVQGIPPGQYMATLKGPQKSTRGGAAIFMAIDGMGGPQKGKPVAIEAGEETEQDLFLPPTGRVAGVVSEAGKPLANVVVSVKPKDSPMPMDIGNDKTDDRGHYEIADIEPGEYSLSVKPAGAAIPIAKKVEVRARETVDADVKLPTGGLSGKIVDRDSKKGLENLTIEVHRHRSKNGADDAPRESRSVVMISAVSSGGGGGGMQTMKFGDDEDSVKTDAEGKYTVHFLEPGEYDVEIKGGGISPDKRESVTVAEGKIVPNIDFDAIRGASLIITAKSANDSPIQFVTIEIHPTDKPDDQKREANGGNQITVDGLKPGEYTLTVSSNDKEGTATVTLASGDKKPLEVTLH